MLVFLISIAFGYWLHRHVGIERSNGHLSLEFHHIGIINDVRWAWSKAVIVCSWVIRTGRLTHGYISSLLLSWKTP